MLLYWGARNGKLKQWIENKGHLPFNQNVRSEFSATSSSDWNSFFQNFQKRGQPREEYPNLGIFFSRKFSFHSTLLREFLEFSVEWFAFRKFNSFRIFWKLFRKSAAPFAGVSKFSKVLVEWTKVTDRFRVQVTFCSHFSFSSFPFPVPRSTFTTFVAFECNLFRSSSIKPMFTLTTLQAFIFGLGKVV